MTSTQSFRPRDGSVAGTVSDSSLDAVEGAVAAAAAAAPVLASTAPAARRDWLHAIADTLEAHVGELVALADEETALGEVRLTGEVARAAGQLRFYGDVALEGSYLGRTIDNATTRTPRLVRVNRPLGPVAVFGASNFPFAFSVLGNDTASALAAGCPVVAKAHPAHALLSERLAALTMDALRRSAAPDGTFGLVSGLDAGRALVQSEAVAAVAFTGSQAGGMALWRLANERPVVIPVYAEMGTVNPAVVTPAGLSRLAEIAVGFVGSFTLGAGQFCTKPGILLAPAGAGVPAAVGAALAEAAPVPVMLTRSIAAAVDAGLADLTAVGARVVHTVAGGGPGWSAPAAVLSAPASALTPGSRLLEECFGAVAVVVEYSDRAELADALETLQGSLAASVLVGGDDDPDARWLVDRLTAKVGRVTVNEWPTGVAFTWAQQHGGPWPATTVPSATSVGAAALGRFVRPVTFQSVPDAWLPPETRVDNPWGLPQRVDGRTDALPRSRA